MWYVCPADKFLLPPSVFSFQGAGSNYFTSSTAHRCSLIPTLTKHLRPLPSRITSTDPQGTRNIHQGPLSSLPLPLK